MIINVKILINSLYVENICRVVNKHSEVGVEYRYGYYIKLDQSATNSYVHFSYHWEALVFCIFSNFEQTLNNLHRLWYGFIFCDLILFIFPYSLHLFIYG